MLNRRIVSLLGALLGLASVLPVAAWQEATPESGFADLDLPTLEVNVTTTGFEGIPEQLEAGRYLVTVNAAADTGFGGAVGFVQPGGMSADEFLSALAGMGAPEGETALGTPGATADATPSEAGGEMGGMGGPPSFIYEATYAGGGLALAGQSAQVVLDLTPGQWIAWGEDPAASQEPVIFEATGEMPADLPEPAADVTVVMADNVVNVEGELRAGSQVVEVQNVGAQPHFIFVAKVPDGLTEDQLAGALDEEMAAEMSGTPVAYSDFNPDEDAIPVAYTATQSTGTTMWVNMNLEPGTHALICFFPDLESGIPHAYLGMYTVVEVSE
jgi:hypothetical protein